VRKIIVSMWITLDGFVAGPQDEMDWLLIDDQMQRYERELVEGSGSLMLGRGTHADFAGYWPQAAHDLDQPAELRAYARRVDAMEKIVVSASGNTVPWQNTRRLERIDPDEITELKRGSDGNIVIYGSLAVIRSLDERRLVDEFHLLVHPPVPPPGQGSVRRRPNAGTTGNGRRRTLRLRGRPDEVRPHRLLSRGRRQFAVRRR
jgi:dihydrofolate reductase